MLSLSEKERSMLAGEVGQAQKMAMEILVAYARALGASHFVPIVGAHIDGCLYHGDAGLDFVEALVQRNGRVRVPTTLNVGSMDLIHPEIIRLSSEQQKKPIRLMRAHEELGCLASFTCAPYQTMFRPRFGDQIAWGESNAIVFANSVIGARTERYGDFIDLCCALTGMAPATGLHLDEYRLGQVHFRLSGFALSMEPTDTLFTGVGITVGKYAGSAIPVIEGLPSPRDEDQLKALGAAAASIGSVGLFHAVGITPEAPTVSQAFDNKPPEKIITIRPDDLYANISNLSLVEDGGSLGAICLGTPHFSLHEWRRLAALLADIQPDGKIPIYVHTGRETFDAVRSEGIATERFGLVPVVDTCTYVTAILKNMTKPVMTNSGKWAYYAPSNIGCATAYGELEDCVLSAAAGKVVRRRYD